MTDEELAILRRRMAIPPAQHHRPSEGCPAYVGQTYSGGSYPTTVPRMFLTRPAFVASAESEGATPTITTDATTSVPVLVQGGPVPAIGSILVAKMTQGLWIALQGGGTPAGGGTIPITGCQCASQTPSSIIWTSTDPKLPSCTITYQPTPYPSGGYADASGNLFLGPQMYDAFGAGFRIYLYCNLQYRIGPIYDDYPTPAAYSYMGDYRFFTTAASPNSCSPWSFTKSTNVALSLSNQTDISMAPGP